MNDQNETTQLRYLEETATRLRQNGFTVEPIKDHHLPVCWEKGRLCRVSGKGSVLYRQENVDSIRAQDALQTVIDTAKMTSEYMAILETAPRLKASGLDGDYRVLVEMSRNVQSGNTQNLKSMVIQRSFPKWSVAERRKTAAASDQAAVCACAHSRYFTGGSPSGLRV